MQRVSGLLSSDMGDYLTNRKAWGPVMYNVLEHGLVGDGVTDNTMALQELVNLASSEGRKAIFFPHTPTGGKYFVTSLTNADKVVFFGDNSSFVGGYVGDIYQMGDWVTSEQLNENSYKTVDLFAMSGQSNMQGQSEGPPVPFEIPKYKAYEYKLLTESLETVKHPFGENISDFLAQAVNGWGSLSPRFADAYFNTTGTPPLMVGVAKGATFISEWIGNSRYSKMVEKVNKASTEAISSGLIVRNKCFVWLHGESDGLISTTKKTYKQRFMTLWNDLKRDCGFNKCLIIRVAKFEAANIFPIIKAQEELAREHDDIILLTRITGTFTTGNGLMQSHWHYTNAGYDLVGSTAGAAAGKYLSVGIKPTLETEPYPEAAVAANGQYAWNFRDGSTTGGITLSNIGTPVVNPTDRALDGNSGFKLSKDINLDGDATLSFTCLFTAPASTGMLTSYDGDPNSDFIFFYFALKSLNIADPSGSPIIKFTETDAIIPVVGVYNHYVIQKSGRIYSLYFNGKQIQTIFSGPKVININNLFFAAGSLGLKGKVKHCMINKGLLIPPKEADPQFYAGAEQGTT